MLFTQKSKRKLSEKQLISPSPIATHIVATERDRSSPLLSPMYALSMTRGNSPQKFNANIVLRGA